MGRLAKPKKSFDEWLQKMYIPEPNSGCWIWLGATARNGQRPYLQIEGMPRAAHRAIYSFYRGVIPQGLVLDHLCRVTLCVNPHHLEAVTSWTNVQRGNPCPPTLNAAKTACIHGHLFNHKNTGRLQSTGERVCRACARERQKKYQKRRFAN